MLSPMGQSSHISTKECPESENIRRNRAEWSDAGAGRPCEGRGQAEGAGYEHRRGSIGTRRHGTTSDRRGAFLFSFKKLGKRKEVGNAMARVTVSLATLKAKKEAEKKKEGAALETFTGLVRIAYSAGTLPPFDTF